MNPYTVFVYIVPAGGHLVETVDADNPTAAVIQLRERLSLKKEECEVIAVARGQVNFECADAARVALAPYCSPEP